MGCLGLPATPKNLEIGLRTNSVGIPYTSLLRIEAIGSYRMLRASGVHSLRSIIQTPALRFYGRG